MAEEKEDSWQSITLGDNNHLRPLFDAAETAATVNKTALAVAKAQYETYKSLALASINPAFLALSALITQVQVALQDLLNTGYFTIFVNAKTMEESDTVKPVTFGSFVYDKMIEVPAYRNTEGELVGAIRGYTVPDQPPLGKSIDDETKYEVGVGKEVPQAVDISGPLGRPLTKMVPNYSDSPSGVTGKSKNAYGLVELKPADIIATLVEAFDDENDKQKQWLDENGNVVESEAKAAIQSPTSLPRYKMVDRRPTFGEDSLVGGLVFIVGASTITEFAKLLYYVREFFNVTEIDDLLKEITKLLHIPKTTISLQDVHLIGKLDDGQVKRSPMTMASKLASKKKDEHLVLIEQGPGGEGDYTGFVGEVISSLNFTAPEIMSTPQPPLWQKRNINTLPYYNETIEIQPFTQVKNPTPGNVLIEARIKSDIIAETGSTAERLDPNKKGSKIKNEAGEDIDLSEQEWQAKKVVPGDPHIFVSRVRHNLDEPKSKPPDFTSTTIKELIPSVGNFVNEINSSLEEYKGMVKLASDSIQPTIDMIDKRVKKAENVATTVIKIQEQFNALRNAGLYSLELPPERGGTAHLKSRLQAAVNQPPSSLTFCAGFMMVAGSPDGMTSEAIAVSHNTLKSLLGM